FGLGAQDQRRKLVRKVFFEFDVRTHRLCGHVHMGRSATRLQRRAAHEQRLFRTQRYARLASRVLRRPDRGSRTSVIAIGLMSGTSLDGVDAVLVRIRPRRRTYAVDLLNFLTCPFDEDLLELLRGQLPPSRGSVEGLAQVHHDLGIAFARAAELASADTPVDYIASHGQTIWHNGERHVTLQLGDAFVIREILRTTVCYDFR